MTDSTVDNFFLVYLFFVKLVEFPSIVADLLAVDSKKNLHISIANNFDISFTWRKLSVRGVLSMVSALLSEKSSNDGPYL